MTTAIPSTTSLSLIPKPFPKSNKTWHKFSTEYYFIFLCKVTSYKM